MQLPVFCTHKLPTEHKVLFMPVPHVNVSPTVEVGVVIVLFFFNNCLEKRVCRMDKKNDSPVDCEGDWHRFGPCERGMASEVFLVDRWPVNGGKECPTSEDSAHAWSHIERKVPCSTRTRSEPRAHSTSRMRHDNTESAFFSIHDDGRCSAPPSAAVTTHDDALLASRRTCTEKECRTSDNLLIAVLMSGLISTIILSKWMGHRIALHAI